MKREPCPAFLSLEPQGERLLLLLGGEWTLKASCLPSLAEIALALEHHPATRRVVVDGGEIGAYDSRLVLFLLELEELLEGKGVPLERRHLPEGVERLLELARSGRRPPPPPPPREGLLVRIGEVVLSLASGAVGWLAFLGEVVLAAGNLLRGRVYWRWRDFWELLERCGPRALPIVSLIALLVGMVLAYVGALQLQMFGAEVFVADLVGIGMLREMGAMMTAVIMAGRTGASYAAQLGTMQVNEEIDAFRTLAISPIETLVLPRLLALTLMVPLLTLYADFVGILGGAVAAAAVFDLSFLEYFQEMGRMVALEDALVGLIKAVVFGIWIALAGCLRGILCGRSAEAVGEATTGAVVAAIVGIVVFDALLTILFTHLGI